jgi:hypothetical protein
MDKKYNLMDRAARTGIALLIGGVTLFDVVCSENICTTLNNYECTSDIIGNRDRYSSDAEKQFLDEIVKETRNHKVKNAYMPFFIRSDGMTISASPILYGHVLPNIHPEGLKLTEYPGITQDELEARLDAGKPLPKAKEWTLKDFYNHFGFYEINKKGEITNIYLLTPKGMMIFQ